jgi:hypothetical protein
MGLDMYAYSAADAKQYDKYWSNYHIDIDGEKSVCSKPIEIMYWRKHPNLHGWMTDLWHLKCNPLKGELSPAADEFNGVQLELTWEDLDKLEDDVKNKRLPATSGFFFGNNADEYYYEQDLKFINEARADLFMGLRVFYNSSW